ncbi:hypothetical protein AVEN_114530-1 [Araneus ventricosus]|uniref:Reverse transcriptase domain-containing protein n=1 Tax=Araneus ventricosus TaxID=182803 RepID=A0A4Y2QKR7_ARAVE|nr:hypothetical protein AVEN_114530-1 [Araneus ventricosus]
MEAANQALLERTKKIRSVTRSIVTKQTNKLESEINNSVDKTIMYVLYMQLISKFEELVKLDKEIEGLIDIDSLEDEILTCEDYRDKFIIWKTRAERYIESVSNIAIRNSAETQLQNAKISVVFLVERTSCDSLSNSQGFYLPHHAVIRSDKTTIRLRIVFDGSAHEDGRLSWNQSLYTGPNLHPNIFELLLRFRENPVAFTADVKSSFLQIELDLPDRDFTRFFWTDNLNNEPYVLNFTRVLFGLRPSPYLLAATLKHHFEKYEELYPHTFDLLNSSVYVDDLIGGRNDVPDALRTTLECLQIFSDAGMLLRKW